MQQFGTSRPALRKTPLFLLSVAGACVGFAAVLWATGRYGPGISHDSVAYLFAAKSLLAGHGLEYFGYPSPYLQWPPLFPALLAMAGLFGMDAVTAARWLNAFSLAGIILYGGLLLSRLMHHRASALVGISLLVFSAPLIRVSKYVWTEPSFILLFLCFLDAFERYLRVQRRLFLVLASIALSLCWMDRYIGVAVVMTGGLFLLWEGRRPLLRRCQDLLLYAAITVPPIALWMVRNYLLSGTTMGMRRPSTDPLAANIRLTLDSFAAWLRPDPHLPVEFGAGVLAALRLLTAAVPLACLAAVVMLAVFGRLRSADSAEEDRRLWLLKLLAVFLVIYLAQLIGSATWIAFESINDRYVSVLYVPAIFAFAAAVDVLLSRPVFQQTTAARVSWRVVLVLAMVVPVLVAADEVNTARTAGAGIYASAPWQENPLIGYLRAQPRTACGYYSNYADGVYALTGIRAYMPPKKTGLAMYGLAAFRQQVERQSCNYVVWFAGWSPGGVYGVEELGGMYRLEPVYTHSAGVIYRLTARP